MFKGCGEAVPLELGRRRLFDSQEFLFLRSKNLSEVLGFAPKVKIVFIVAATRHQIVRLVRENK